MTLYKKPAAALLSSLPNALLSTLSPPTSSLAPPCRPWSRQGDAPSTGRISQCRAYASIHDCAPGAKEPEQPSDPPCWPTSARPTPYEIFGLARDAPYCKARYFQLAKLYHPDTNRHVSGDGIPHATKLERYRLVVVANEILRDPQKRRMYDLCGLGWDNGTGPFTDRRPVDHTWRKRPGNASMNATWEDWERWRQQRDGTGEKQEEVFTSNLKFMAVISAFLIVGTWSQMTRAGANSASLFELRAQQDAAISQELQDLRRQRMSQNREGRVENFLRQREFERWPHDSPPHGLPAPDGTKGSD
ncbi:hypothetical protein C8A05DRAFT_47233 [Staphylotrichum tortipilum]|uniref:J domain-containing protein n=1 Tax=Staphylotrichum tortipilum TaxID=2831512 RepID=A0AAN6ME82_9PEZI|nr:hypothetical protein C8A05DRAFT_47233 [Staphylotrichum longicolle]